MNNSGYSVIARRKKEDLPDNPGQQFYCPVCKRIILEAKAEKFRTRCKHCGSWIYAEKVA